jgi:hypothetical protein
MSTSQSELRLASLLDERDTVMKLHETVVASVQTNEDKLPTGSQSEMIKGYREKEVALDDEIEQLTEDIERNRRAVASSLAVRKILAGGSGSVEQDGDEVAYRTMAAYARDVILTGPGRASQAIAQQYADPNELDNARTRLQLAKRTPANTLSSNVAGLIPDQHIAQIFQVINRSRPLVASATQADLNRGVLQFPKITQRPVVAVQSTQKTEAGNTGMIVGMESATASTYLGGGDLSWQAINWSTPNALDLWFDLTAADYALKTEQDAGEVLQTAAFLNNIASTISTTPTHPQLMTAIAAGLAEVWANSGDVADTLYMSVDMAAFILGLTSATPAVFANASLSFAEMSGNIAGLNVVISRGLDAGVVAVGVRSKLICAETPGAPVELRVVEPAIGGVEVGLIGAFEAVVAEDEAFALLSTAS